MLYVNHFVVLNYADININYTLKINRKKCKTTQTGCKVNLYGKLATYGALVLPTACRSVKDMNPICKERCFEDFN